MRSIFHATTLALATMFLGACDEPPGEQEQAETSDLANCSTARTELAPETGGPPPPISAENAARASACAELNAHLASIAHIRALLDGEMLEDEGAAQ